MSHSTNTEKLLAIICVLIALVIGGMIGFWAFAVLFTRSFSDAVLWLIMPLTILFGAGFGLRAFAPRSAWLLMGLFTAPTILIFLVFIFPMPENHTLPTFSLFLAFILLPLAGLGAARLVAKR